MNIKEAILQLIREKKSSQSLLAQKMGYRSQSAVGQMLLRKNLNVSTLIRICDIYDYELTIQPKRQRGARPEGQIVIDSTGEEKGEA